MTNAGATEPSMIPRKNLAAMSPLKSFGAALHIMIPPQNTTVTRGERSIAVRRGLLSEKDDLLPTKSLIGRICRNFTAANSLASCPYQKDQDQYESRSTRLEVSFSREFSSHVQSRRY